MNGIAAAEGVDGFDMLPLQRTAERTQHAGADGRRQCQKGCDRQRVGPCAVPDKAFRQRIQICVVRAQQLRGSADMRHRSAVFRR